MVHTNEKQRRMQIRIKTGSRKLNDWPEQATHNGATYLLAYVCFDCRLSTKQTYSATERLCSRCKTPLAGMGRAFKTPKKSNTEQWKKIKLLYQSGETFSKYNGATPLPKTLKKMPYLFKTKEG